MDIAFRQVKAFMSEEVDPAAIEYRDSTGTVWTVPEEHRIWIGIYQPWLIAGNTPLPLGATWPVT